MVLLDELIQLFGLASGVGHPAQLTVYIAERLIFLKGLEGRAGIFVAARTA